MQTLLIFDEIPESQLRILIPDAPDWLPEVDGLFLNCDEMTERQESLLMRVNDALASELGHCNDKTDPLACQWRKHEIDPRAIIEGPVQIIRCGFLI